MSEPAEDIERLAQELLGRSSEELDEQEQRVLARVAAGTYIGIDAHEAAQLNAGFGERLADRVARVGGSWSFTSPSAWCWPPGCCSIVAGSRRSACRRSMHIRSSS